LTENATNVTTNSARLEGQLVSLGSASMVGVSFEWGTSPGSYPNEHTAQTMTSGGTFSVDLAGLAPGTTYYYRAKAVGDGVSYGDEQSFTTSTTPPLVVTSAAGEVGTSSARLHGNLTSMGTASTLYVSYQWGTSPEFYSGETTPREMTAAEAFSLDLTGLNPGTTYYFRAKAVGDGAAYGLEESFSTLTLPPSVATGEATDLTIDSATLNGDLTSLGTATSVNVCFEWGADSGSYDDETAILWATAAETFSLDLTGLTSGTTYFFRVRADGPHGTAYSAEGSFTTLTVPPSVATEDAMNITEETATLAASLVSLGTAEMVDVSFLWGTTQGGPYLNETTAQTATYSGTVSLEINELTPGTTYYYVVEAFGDNVTYGAEESFTTLPPDLSVNPENSANDAVEGELETESSANASAGVLDWVGAGLVLGIAAFLLIKALPR
jgi:phosphodiesterase/alkaline phosphatase D-like protein